MFEFILKIINVINPLPELAPEPKLKTKKKKLTFEEKIKLQKESLANFEF